MQGEDRRRPRLGGSAGVRVRIHDPAAGALGTEALLATLPTPSAIFAFSDQLALGAMHAAAATGIAVPGELSVVGFDDSPAAVSAVPTLTTVAQPLLDRGRAVGLLVRALLAGAQVISPEPYPVRLVVRDSSTTAPGPSEDPVSPGRR